MTLIASKLKELAAPIEIVIENTVKRVCVMSNLLKSDLSARSTRYIL